LRKTVETKKVGKVPGKGEKRGRNQEGLFGEKCDDNSLSHPSRRSTGTTAGLPKRGKTGTRPLAWFKRYLPVPR